MVKVQGRRSKRGPPDRLSKMPIEVLHKILNLLPRKEARKTQWISRRWRSVWKSFAIMDFDSSHIDCRKQSSSTSTISPGEGSPEFINYVSERISKSEAKKIEKFRLCLHSLNADINSKVNEWVDFAIKRRVKELEINTPVVTKSRYGSKVIVSYGLDLSANVFQCSSIEVLKLKGCKIATPTSGWAFNLQNLRELSMMEVHVEDHTVERLLTHCRLIEHLSFQRCYELKSIWVCSRVLKSMVLDRCENLKTLVLDAPNLVDLKFVADFMPLSTTINTPSLLVAEIDLKRNNLECKPGHMSIDADKFRRDHYMKYVRSQKEVDRETMLDPGLWVERYYYKLESPDDFYQRELQLRSLLMKFMNAKELTLSIASAKQLLVHKEDMGWFRKSIPPLYNLSQLTLNTRITGYISFVEFLDMILSMAPHLHTLILNIYYPIILKFRYDNLEVEKHVADLQFHYDNKQLERVQDHVKSHVADHLVCLREHLIEVEIENLGRNADEVDLFSFLMKKGKALRKMTLVNSCGWSDKMDRYRSAYPLVTMVLLQKKKFPPVTIVCN